MTGRYKAYAEYKESNYEWLGDVPSHWDVAYSKWLFSERNTKANQSDEMLTASQKYGVIPQKLFMRLEQQKVVQVQKGHDILKQVKKNDFVISMRSFQGGIEFCEYDGAVSSAYVPLEPKEELNLGYFKYLFKSKPYIQALQATTNLVRDGQALRYNNFLQVYIPVPEQKEAEKIGSFLDHETAKIDTLITKQEKLIELLKEKRQAVISHAVTKGLNPDATMKDSGVEWLGEVPEHWERKSLNYLIAHTVDNRGRTPPIQDDGIPMVEVSQVAGNGYFTSSDYKKFISQKSYREFVRSDIKENDILFVTVGATFGKTCLVPPEPNFFIAQNVVGFRCTQQTDAKYLMLLLSSNIFKEAISSTNKSSTIDNIKVSDLVKTRVVIPPMSEQVEISNYILESTIKLDSLIKESEKMIELIKERKTALISAAVTGKIDVRDWIASDEENNG